MAIQVYLYPGGIKKPGKKVNRRSNQFSEHAPYHHRTYLFTPDTSSGLDSVSQRFCTVGNRELGSYKTSLDSLVDKNSTACNQHVCFRC